MLRHRVPLGMWVLIQGTDMTCALLEWQLEVRQGALETDPQCKMGLNTLI